MGQIYEVKINNFSGGISEDKRANSPTKYAITKHFDTFTYPHKIIPYYQTKADETKDYNIVNFLYAQFVTGGQTVYRLYGLGAVSGTTKPQVFVYDIDTSYTGGWQALADAKSKSTVFVRNTEIFFYYKRYIYMSAPSVLMRFDTTLSVDFNNSYQVTNDMTAAPVHHTGDDCAYFFGGNVVYRLNNTSWDGIVLTLPDNMNIYAACAYGNYLAIACTELGNNPKSVVYLWDRDSSLTTLTERIDFGFGKIVHLASLQNKLTAVMGTPAAQGTSLYDAKVVIKQSVGTISTAVSEIKTDSYSASDIFYLPSVRFVEDDKLYFVAQVPFDGDSRGGVWAVDANGRISLELVEGEAITGEDTSTEKISYQGIYKTGNVWWIAHSGDGSVNRLDDQRGYSATRASIYESLIFNHQDTSLTKKLLVAGVMTESLSTAGQIVLKYRKDEDISGGSWTTIFTHTTDNSLYHEAINIESTGVTLPEFREIQFRIESTGGAVITGLKFKYEIIDKNLA